MCETCGMLILDKTRALQMILWNSERIAVPEQFLMGVGEGGDEEADVTPPPVPIRARVAAIYAPAVRVA